VRDLVGDPQGYQLGLEPQSERLVVGLAREMLETHEGDPATAHHQLARVGAPHTHHEVHVELPVDLEDLLTPLHRFLCHGNHVVALQQHAQVPAVGGQRSLDDLLGVWAVEVEDVVVPVGGEDGEVFSQIATIRLQGVRCVERGEEFRNEVDQHGGATNLRRTPNADKPSCSNVRCSVRCYRMSFSRTAACSGAKP
jgi:hypothetical protein